jgi:hypothetical protein
MLLLAAFVGLAPFLSALGIHGVVACNVSQRTRGDWRAQRHRASRGQIACLIPGD